MQDNGPEKVKKICDVLRKETIEPARVEANKIIHDAKIEAGRIINHAKSQSSVLLKETNEKIEQEKSILSASLNLAVKKSLSLLRESIEDELFNPALSQTISEAFSNPNILVELLKSIISAIDSEGTDADIKAVVSNKLDIKQINESLGSHILSKLRSESVVIGNVQDGAKVSLLDKKITFDISDDALKRLISDFVREDFRALIFSV